MGTAFARDGGDAGDSNLLRGGKYENIMVLLLL